MLIIKIAGIAILTTVAITLVKPQRPEIAIMLGLAGGLLIILSIIDVLGEVINTFNTIGKITNIDSNLIKLILKIIGIGYICEFCSNICLDSGCSILADKVIFAGKLIIMVMVLPIITSLVEIITALMV